MGDDFKEQLSRQEGLVKNMGIMINKWLVPPPEDKKKPIKESLAEILPVNVFSKDFWTNSKRMWVTLIFLVNIVIMSQRVYYFSSFAMLNGYIPNFFYLTSRANEIQRSIALHVAVKPADEVRCLSVNTWIASLSTPVSPGDNTRKLAAAHEWTTGISLARVL